MALMIYFYFAILSLVNAFYLPGLAPREFAAGDFVDLKVNKLTSTKTQLPYEYYHLNFCRPEKIKQVSENLGELLSGDRIENSVYEIYMNEELYCQFLCQRTNNMKDLKKFRQAIDEEYKHNWIVDNLPAASVVEIDNFETVSYTKGFPVGFRDSVKGEMVYNHVNLLIYYHPVGETTGKDMISRIVGFYVEPLSIKHRFEGDVKWDGTGTHPTLTSCSTTSPTVYESVKENQPAETGPIVFTYDVRWEESETAWASRWDIYLSMDNAIPNRIHWFSIFNSLVIVFFLTGMIGMILVRNLKRDLSRYNRAMTDEEKAEEKEEYGWKLVHADVFRAPTTNPMLLCVFVGSGVQILFMALITVFFSALGFLSPANRGGLMIALILLYTLMGSFAGYYSAHLNKSMKGKLWQRSTIYTALLYPGVCFAVFLILDLVVWSEGSSEAVPFLTMVSILFLWFGISVPLVFIGAYIGFRKESIEFPVKSSNIPRQIPDQPWYLGDLFSIAIGGVLPFGSCFVEFFFILSSIWMDQYYYVFGFLLLVLIILLITCAEISIVLVYFQLCAENYNWWWRSFLASGSTGIYIFIYSTFYFARLESNLAITYLLYFSYMAIVSFGIFLLTGCVGFGASLWFAKVIYGSIKVD